MVFMDDILWKVSPCLLKSIPGCVAWPMATICAVGAASPTPSV